MVDSVVGLFEVEEEGHSMFLKVKIYIVFKAEARL